VVGAAIVGVSPASTVAVATAGIVACVVACTGLDVPATVAVGESAAVGVAGALLSQAVSASASNEIINIAKRSGLVCRKVKIVSYQT
jgi:hypothetical protein